MITRAQASSAAWRDSRPYYNSSLCKIRNSCCVIASWVHDEVTAMASSFYAPAQFKSNFSTSSEDRLEQQINDLKFKTRQKADRRRGSLKMHAQHFSVHRKRWKPSVRRWPRLLSRARSQQQLQHWQLQEPSSQERGMAKRESGIKIRTTNGICSHRPLFGRKRLP